MTKGAPNLVSTLLIGCVSTSDQAASIKARRARLEREANGAKRISTVIIEAPANVSARGKSGVSKARLTRVNVSEFPPVNVSMPAPYTC